MIFNFTILKFVDPSDSISQVSPQIEVFLFFAFSISIFTFISLMVYMNNIIDLLKPENILEKLAQEIELKKITPKDDPFQSLFDMIYSAILKFDLTTMSTGFEVAVTRFYEIFLEEEKNIYISYVVERFFDDFKRCANFVIDRKEQKSTFEIIIRIGELGKISADDKLWLITFRSINTIDDIGISTINVGFVNETDFCLDCLKVISNSVLNITDALQIFTQRPAWAPRYSPSHGIQTDNSNEKNILKKIIQSIEKIVISSRDKGMTDQFLKGITYIKEIRKNAERNNFIEVMEVADKSIKTIMGNNTENLKEEGDIPSQSHRGHHFRFMFHGNQKYRRWLGRDE
jgi:hypothetical protein